MDEKEYIKRLMEEYRQTSEILFSMLDDFVDTIGAPQTKDTDGSGTEKVSQIKK